MTSERKSFGEIFDRVQVVFSKCGWCVCHLENPQKNLYHIRK